MRASLFTSTTILVEVKKASIPQQLKSAACKAFRKFFTPTSILVRVKHPATSRTLYPESVWLAQFIAI